jgi:pimeloyl-ACP methyl ester carboxylesterase
MNIFARGSSFAFHGYRLPRRILFTAAAGLASLPLVAQPSDTIFVREALGITLPRRTVSAVIPSSPVDAWFSGRRTDPPKEGESVRWGDGAELTWQRITPDSNGWFTDRPPAERYAAVVIDRKTPVRMMLEGMGHDIVLMNGTPRSGNPYAQKDNPDPWEPHFDYSRIPVDLNQGQNLLMFRYTRGRLKVRLVPVAKSIAFNANDTTLPDAVIGTPLDAWGSIVVVNSSGASLKGFSLVCTPAGGNPDTIEIPHVPAMGVRKIAFRIRTSPRAEKGSLALRLALVGKGPVSQNVVDTVTIPLRVIGTEGPRRETFISTTDGSVQYYAVTPPQPGGFRDRPALFFSLHGAGVEALNQAASYEPKKWGVVVAPTNRRPYGFSWEDWGRLDALEVLDIAKKKFNIDEGRVYLTGHSMGGHGTWFMGATYPDKFAAIGPSAGWITFHSYRFTNAPTETSQVKRMLRRSAAPSDLFSLVDNYRHFGIYIIHGAQDDNVLPEQSAMMIERLKPIHKDFEYYEQPGAGHWWDNSPEPGSDCVDWRPLFDFFARHVRPGIDRTRTVEFTTANPGISSHDAWLAIDAQERQLSLSTARLHLDPGLNQVQGTTVNVSRLAIDKWILAAHTTAKVELDSQMNEVHLDSIATDQIWFWKEKGKWHQVSSPSAGVKNARRNGTFKESFRNRMALVYGTAGTPEENRWAFARARYDAEKLWYQGNASVDVLADSEFVPSAEPDRNVVLYGNSQTHRLWKALLPNCPINVDRDRVVLGGKAVKRPDICCIFVRPRSGSDVASVGVVSGTGIEGLKLSHTVMYLEPGLGLPDCTVFTSDVQTKGDAGIILTGFFGPDWTMESGEFVPGPQ